MARFAPDNLKFVRGTASGDSTLVYFTWTHGGDAASYFTIWGLDSAGQTGSDGAFTAYAFPGIADPATNGSTREYGPVTWQYDSLGYGVYWKVNADFSSPVQSLSSPWGTDANASKVTNLSVLSVTQSTITFRWDPPAVYSSAITGYRVYYKQYGTTVWADDGLHVGAPHTIGTVNPLARGTAYDIMVLAVTAGGISTFDYAYQAITVGVTQAATFPDAPYNVVASTPSPSNGTISLSWTAPQDGGAAITGYVIQESLNGGGWTTKVANTGSTSTTASFSGYSFGGSYTYRVAAINSVGTGPFSLASNPVVPSGVPGQVPTLTATSGNLQVLLQWGLPASNGSAITSYVIEISEDGGATWTVSTTVVAPTRIRTITGLTANTTYDFRVFARNAVGDGPPSPVRSATPTSVPSKPLNLVASIDTQDANSAVVKLDWDPPATSNGGAISAYRIQVSKDAGVTWYRTLSSSDWEPWYYVSVDLNETYVFRVAAINFNGTGPYSDNSNSLPVVPPPPGTVAGAPGNVAAVPGHQKLTVSWDTPAVTGTGPITEYKIQYSIDGVTWTTLTEIA